MFNQSNAMNFILAISIAFSLAQILPEIVDAQPQRANKKLRIAHVGGLNVEIPPKDYGGLEKVVEVLIFEQLRAGHHVTLFCTKDSGNLAKYADKYEITQEQMANFQLIHSERNALHVHTRSYDEFIEKIKPHKEYFKEFQQKIVEHVKSGKFDILHYHSMDHFEYDGSILEMFNHLTLTTMHMSLEGERTVQMLAKYPEANLVPISNDQKTHLRVELVPNYKPVWLDTVYNGYPLTLYPFIKETKPAHPSWLKDYPRGHHSKAGTPYLAFLGRFSSDKGAHNAIKIAIKAGVELRLAANIPKEGDQNWEYYSKVLMPLMNGHEHLIKIVGPIDDKQKREFLGNALALLFTIEWQEPFGLVMIEAMAHGTPVIAPNSASVPEVVLKNGGLIFDVSTHMVGHEKRVYYDEGAIEKATKLVEKVGKLDRTKVRKVFEENFSIGVMTEGYQRIYEKLISKNCETQESPKSPHQNNGLAENEDLEE